MHYGIAEPKTMTLPNLSSKNADFKGMTDLPPKASYQDSPKLEGSKFALNQEEDVDESEVAQVMLRQANKSSSRLSPFPPTKSPFTLSVPVEFPSIPPGSQQPTVAPSTHRDTAFQPSNPFEPGGGTDDWPPTSSARTMRSSFEVLFVTSLIYAGLM